MQACSDDLLPADLAYGSVAQYYAHTSDEDQQREGESRARL